MVLTEEGYCSRFGIDWVSAEHFFRSRQNANPITTEGTEDHGGNPITTEGTEDHGGNPITTEGTEDHEGNPITTEGTEDHEGHPITTKGHGGPRRKNFHL
jgi:hypothetical protein